MGKLILDTQAQGLTTIYTHGQHCGLMRTATKGALIMK